ncbi:acetate--CoA ligase, partial [Arthrobacter crystallopoietes BAB-32]
MGVSITEPASVLNWPEPQTEEERIAFWEDAARRLEWAEPWHTAHSATPVDVEARRGPELRWFDGGKLNAAVNCTDRHVAAGRGDKVALHFEGEPGDRRTVTYRELQELVSQAANALQALGVGKGDRVVIYLPVLVETVVITLACARIGAVHSLVFGGFSAEALRFRVEDTGAKLLVTTDGQYRRGQAVPVKDNADAAVSGDNAIEHVLVLRRTGSDIAWTEGRDVWWHDVVDTQPRVHEAEAFDAETPLFIMYTSGTTGQPKGLVHTTGGYLTQASFSHEYLFSHPDPAQRDGDVHWCTADLAWVTAHTYEIYGPLSNGVTQVIYEGVPNAPHPGRHFEIIQRYGVTSYYTAPTLVRSLMGWFPEGIPAEYDLSSIRLCGTVGEAVNPEAWRWLRTQVGRDALVAGDPSSGVPMVDTWWQSESGATILSPRQTDSSFKPGCATRALPGVATDIVDDGGAGWVPTCRATSWSPRPAPRWPAPSGGTLSGTSRPTGRSMLRRAGSSPAMAPASTRTATRGSSAGRTTSSTSPGTGCPRSRSSPRWCPTRLWWRPGCAPPTTRRPGTPRPRSWCPWTSRSSAPPSPSRPLPPAPTAPHPPPS